MAEWKPFDLTWGRSIYYCSECEESVDLPTAMGKPIYKYCPMCGAKMNTDRKTEPTGYKLSAVDKDINVRSNSSEKPNNCEHITEDGVTCARYPACDDCPDNPLNKVKGSERLVKGTEQTEPQYSEDDMYWLSLAEDVANGKMSDAGANQAWLEYINHKDEPTISKMEQVDWKDQMWAEAVEDEPQTERSE